VSEAAIEERPHASWTDRLFERVPVAPVWVGIATALALLVLFLAVAWASGGIAQFLAQKEGFLRVRDARMGLFVVLLVAYLPTARRYAVLGARRNLDDLRQLLPAAATQIEAVRRSIDPMDARRNRIAGAIGLLVAPATALAIDRDPSMYLEPSYWRGYIVVTWILGFGIGWHLGSLVHTILEISRCFSQLARSGPAHDLFDRGPVAPFVRQGLRSALLCVILVSLFAINLVDQGFLWMALLLVPAVLAVATATLVLPVRGVRDRIRAAKGAELERIHGALRGDPHALSGSAIAARAEGLGLADLLAYRSFVESVRESPFDTPTLLRFTLYLAIPLGSWLGGALVERLLGALLD
jgi:uncharacterized membrane protein YedE/YeeE